MDDENIIPLISQGDSNGSDGKGEYGAVCDRPKHGKLDKKDKDSKSTEKDLSPHHLVHRKKGRHDAEGEVLVETHEESVGDGKVHDDGEDAVDGERHIEDEETRHNRMIMSHSHANLNESNWDDPAINDKHENFVKKSATRTLMDASLMMTNISQLRTLIELGSCKALHFYVILVLISLSLLMQMVYAVCMFMLALKESKLARKKDYLDQLDWYEDHGMPKAAADKLRAKMVNAEEDINLEDQISSLHIVTIFMVFVVTVINMFITGFGIRNKCDV